MHNYTSTRAVLIFSVYIIVAMLVWVKIDGYRKLRFFIKTTQMYDPNISFLAVNYTNLTNYLLKYNIHITQQYKNNKALTITQIKAWHGAQPHAPGHPHK